MSMKYPQIERAFLVGFEMNRISVNGVHMPYAYLLRKETRQNSTSRITYSKK